MFEYSPIFDPDARADGIGRAETGEARARPAPPLTWAEPAGSPRVSPARMTMAVAILGALGCIGLAAFVRFGGGGAA